MAIMGRDPFGIFKEGEVHTISYRCQLVCRSALQARMPSLMAICTIADASYPCRMLLFRWLLFNRFLRQLALQGASMHVQRTCGGGYVAVMLGEYLLQVFPLQALYG